MAPTPPGAGSPSLQLAVAANGPAQRGHPGAGQQVEDGLRGSA
jgi:hypothetical protein